MAKKHDVIVVGGGPGGLTCAALLAKWGLKPLLLDKNESTGGKAVTISRNGFIYDLAPKLQCPMRGSAIEKAHVMLGIESELRPIYLEGEKGIAMSYRSRGRDRYRTEVHSQQGTDAAGLFDLLELNAEERERTVSIMTDIALMSQEGLDALDGLTFEEYLARHKDVPDAVYSYLAMMSNSSLAEPIDLVSASEQVRIMQDIFRGGGGGYYAGGFGRVLNNLEEAISANGGEVRTQTRVERIEVSDGRVIGVVAGGKEFKAPIVVSDAGIQPTVLRLVGEEHFDKGYVNYIKGLVPGWGFTAVRYFLNKPVLKQAAYMIYSDESWWNMERYVSIRKGRVPEEVIIFGLVPSNYDSTMSPSGKQCFIAGTICPPDPQEQQVQMLYGKMDEMLERVYPEVMDALDYKEYEGPAEISASTRDQVLPGQGGECVGLGQVVGQCGKYKPSPKAPIRGLFYVGCDAGSAGMGTHQAADSGIKVAHMVFWYHRLGLAAR